MDLQEALTELELDSTATHEQAKAAYRRLIRIWHPDVNEFRVKNEAEEKTKRLAEANEILENYFRRDRLFSRSDLPPKKAAPSDTSPKRRRHATVTKDERQRGSRFGYALALVLLTFSLLIYRTVETEPSRVAESHPAVIHRPHTTATHIAGIPFHKVFTFREGFEISSHPTGDGRNFDCYFTPVVLDKSLAGRRVEITRIAVSTTGTNSKDYVNWDTEVFAGAEAFGLPVGQFTQTPTDPVRAYSRTSPTQAHFTYGIATPGAGSHKYRGEYDFPTSALGSSSPACHLGATPMSSVMSLSQGLYVQVYCWTGDIKSSMLISGLVLTIDGRSSSHR